MALTCPKCDRINNCDCTNCGATENLIIIDFQNNLYQCSHCGHKFDEQDSLDHDWDKLIKRFKEKITPQMCLDWVSAIGKERKRMEVKWGSFGFESAFKLHFGISYKKCTREIFQNLKLQVHRDSIITDLIK